MAEYIIDKLKERTTGKVLYPETLLESIKESENEDSKNLRKILEGNGIPLDYELYGYAVCLANPNPQTRIQYFEMAKGKRPAFWNYVNGYFDYGDWAHAFFIKNNFPCMVKYDGTMDYKLDPENYNLKADGTVSDVANTEYEGSAMSAIPTIWFKRWEDDNYLYCLICNKQLDENFHAYMHTRPDGTIAEYKYISMYPPTLYTDKYKALAETTITAGKTFSDELLFTHNIGENWEIMAMCDWTTFQDLFTLLAKSDNFQTSFGYGLVNGSLVTKSDPGNTKFGGAFYNSAGLNANSYQKVFHLHHLYSELGIRYGGMIYKNGVLYVKPYPPYNMDGDGYINTGITITGSNGGYIGKSTMNEYGRFPLVLTGGSATTYECDVTYYNNTIISVPYAHTAYSYTTAAGKMAMRFDGVATTTSNWVSPRLTCFSVDSAGSLPKENIE